jgi:acyl-CoA synthetase (NDP forming)
MFGAARRVALATTAKAPKAGALASPSPFRMAAGHVRFLNVHEYISMELFKTHGIATPECYVADTAEEAEHIATTALNRRTCPSANESAIRSPPFPCSSTVNSSNF